jgi:hypothetical protein
MLSTASAFHPEGANMKALRSWVAAACILALGTGPANAITITETINFTASDFLAGAPVDPVIGSFTITFDPTTSVNVGTTITLNNLNRFFLLILPLRGNLGSAPPRRLVLPHQRAQYRRATIAFF